MEEKEEEVDLFELEESDPYLYFPYS